MREIKFRAKRVDNGRWVFGDLTRDYPESSEFFDMVSFIAECYIPVNGRIGAQIYYEVIPETIGQFTGLCDKNGKEIYEGDICLLFNELFIVCWSNHGWYQKGSGGTICNFEACEIIGKIHDNPELLKV